MTGSRARLAVTTADHPLDGGVVGRQVQHEQVGVHVAVQVGHVGDVHTKALVELGPLRQAGDWMSWRSLLRIAQLALE
eukprot:3450192-Pyramimonas_sp.AAC.1